MGKSFPKPDPARVSRDELCKIISAKLRQPNLATRDMIHLANYYMQVRGWHSSPGRVGRSSRKFVRQKRTFEAQDPEVHAMVTEIEKRVEQGVN